MIDNSVIAQEDRETVDKIVRMLTQVFEKQLIAVYVFGSWITEYKTQDSDIDIAIICEQKTNNVMLWELAQRLAIESKRAVDLLDLNNATTVMKMQVISKGERIYCADKFYCEQYECTAYSAYALLNEERRGILDDIAVRGSVYG